LKVYLPDTEESVTLWVTVYH